VPYRPAGRRRSMRLDASLVAPSRVYSRRDAKDPQMCHSPPVAPDANLLASLLRHDGTQPSVPISLTILLSRVTPDGDRSDGRGLCAERERGERAEKEKPRARTLAGRQAPPIPSRNGLPRVAASHVAFKIPSRPASHPVAGLTPSRDLT